MDTMVLQVHSMVCQTQDGWKKRISSPGLHSLLTSHQKVHCPWSCCWLELNSHLSWSGDLCDKNGQNRLSSAMWKCMCRHLWAVVVMRNRDKGEEKNLAHCLLSSGGRWTQDIHTATEGREVPPPVNFVPEQSSQDTYVLEVCSDLIVEYYSCKSCCALLYAVYCGSMTSIVEAMY